MLKFDVLVMQGFHFVLQLIKIGPLEKKKEGNIYEIIDVWCCYNAIALLFWILQNKLSAQEIQELVKGERNVPLIIDFYATWCGPCILMAQELEMVCGLV